MDHASSRSEGWDIVLKYSQTPNSHQTQPTPDPGRDNPYLPPAFHPGQPGVSPDAEAGGQNGQCHTGSNARGASGWFGRFFRAIRCFFLYLLRRWKTVGIKWKLFSYFAFFTAIMLVLLWTFQVVFLDDFYKSIKIREIRSAATNIAVHINDKDTSTLISDTAKNSEVCILVADLGGQTAYSADVLPDCVIHKMPTYMLNAAYELAQQNGGEYLERFPRGERPRDGIFSDYSGQAGTGRLNSDTAGHLNSSNRMESMIFAKIVTQKDGSELIILLNSTISPVSATVRTLRIQLTCITLVMLLLAAVLALLLSRRISKPIEKMNRSAKVLATGNYDVTFEGQGYREIAELGQTLTYAAEELSKVDSLRRELIANISHDLRTPLTMITGYSEVMRDLPGENTPENIQIVIDEARRLSTLVNDVLDISKLQSGTQQITPKRFNLTDAVEAIMGRYAKLTEQDGYTIRFEYDRRIWVDADELRISQVVYNLVNNAITYTGEDKTVIIRQTIGQGAMGETVRIDVIDSGEGIAADKLPYVWDRYYKVDKVHKRAAVGTGLGLSIVRSILDLHHAAYGVLSTEGEGSDFWFSLPASPPPEKQSESQLPGFTAADRDLLEREGLDIRGNAGRPFGE